MDRAVDQWLRRLQMCVRSGGSCFEHLLRQWHLLSVFVDSDIKHFYLYQSSNETDDYRLVFMVSTSLLRKILNERVSKLHVLREIVAYTFLNECEKIHRFLSSIKKDAQKRKLVPFSASRCT